MALELIKAVSEGGEGLALATIVQVQGSSPRHPGAKMLVGVPAGQLGTVGGVYQKDLKAELPLKRIWTVAAQDEQ